MNKKDTVNCTRCANKKQSLEKKLFILAMVAWISAKLLNIVSILYSSSMSSKFLLKTDMVQQIEHFKL